MPQPTPYNRLYNFTDWQTVNPSKPLPGTELDAELNAVKLTSDQTRANLGLIQRDDGRLANQTVTPDSLSAASLALISQGQYTPRGAWAATTVYAAGDVVEFNLATYLALSAHTADIAFATDLAAGRWLLLANAALSGGAQAVDLFAGDGTTTQFQLSINYANSDAVQVFVNGVAQVPVQDFTVSADQITFVLAPPAPSVIGTSNVMVRGTSVEVQIAASQATAAELNAQGYAAAALVSQGAALSSEQAAAGSASAASGSAAAALASQQAASNSASAASGSASAASGSASAASSSASSASGSASTATSQASAANASAQAASNSAAAALASEQAGANSASAASASAAAALSSEQAAAGSASAASGSASAALASEQAAAGSASAASGSASAASGSASAASGSASSASGSASAALASEQAAAGSASAASGSASAALSSEQAAAGSASAASGSAAAALASEQSAAASFDSFDDRYLGAKSANPTTDNDGDPLIAGALHFNTTAGEMRVWSGTQWVAATVSPDTVSEVEFLATSGQTTYVFGSGYRVGFTYIWLNGVMLADADFTATDGTNITFASPLSLNDEVRIITFKALGSVTIGDISGLQTALDGKQATLVSGTNIKTVNGTSLVGSGDVSISAGISTGKAIAMAIVFG
jgi:hypothetical protein